MEFHLYHKQFITASLPPVVRQDVIPKVLNVKIQTMIVTYM